MVREILHHRVVKCFWSLSLLCVGGLIYVGWRAESLLMFRWFDFLKLSPTVEVMRRWSVDYPLPDWIKFSLPDGLWIASYLFIMEAVWNGEKSLWSDTFLWWVPIVAVGSEILQFFSVVPGTFDVVDLVCYLCAIVLFLLYRHWL